MVFLTIHSVFCVLIEPSSSMVVRRIGVSVPGTVNTAFFDLLKKYIVLYVNEMDMRMMVGIQIASKDATPAR
jgi:hypothetical protein